MSLNQNLIKNLENYLILDKAEYAILLTGEWGSGKSYFVKNYFSKKDLKIIYVSLYGKGTLKDIQDDIYAQLHPLLSHKYFKFGGNLAKGILKGTLKIDLNRDGNDDGTINYQIPDLNLKDQKIDLKKSILIFDDLERSSIELDRVLGFINAFIEHDGIKTLIISNENEINDNNKYYKIKEKTIGKTFEVELDVDTPLKNFIEEIDFYDNKDIVVELFRNYFLSSEFKNLRIIKYTLRELKFFMDSIECDFKNNKKFLKRIVDLFISLSIESKLGNIKVKEIEEVFSLDLVGYLKEKKGEELNEGKKRLKKVKSRLNVIENTILNSDLWEQIIFLHNYDKKNINQQIESSSYFFLDTAPLWRKMMEMRYMDENQITEYCNFIAKELIGGLEKDLDVVMHYCGILLEVIDKELIDIKEINEDMLLIYLECFIVNSLKRIKKNNYSFKEIFFSLYENDHYAGYGFYSRDHPLFKDCRNRLLELKERMLEKVKVFEAETLLDLIDEDWDSFVVKLRNNPYNKNVYGFENVEIFQFINVDIFVEKIIHMNNYKLDDLGFLWKNRYSFGWGEFPNEKLWFKGLKNKLMERSKDLDKVKKFNIKRLLMVID